MYRAISPFRAISRQAAGATYFAVEAALFLSGLQHLARLGVDEMNPPASGTRHGFVNLANG
jgi:hypothetical protein